jgi:hypothetical protein
MFGDAKIETFISPTSGVSYTCQEIYPLAGNNSLAILTVPKPMSPSPPPCDARNHAEELNIFISELSQQPDRESVASELQGKDWVYY